MPTIRAIAAALLLAKVASTAGVLCSIHAFTPYVMAGRASLPVTTP